MAFASMVASQTPACPAITPSESTTPSASCVVAQTTPATGFILNQCDNKSYCPITPKHLENLTAKTCVAYPAKQNIKGYGATACTANTDCFSGTCTAGVCVAKAKGAVCSDSSECDYGFACISNNATPPQSTCLEQIAEGQTCASKYDCVNTAVCVNTKCVKYFSQADKTALGFDESTDGGLSACSSGYSRNQVCLSLVNKDATPNANCNGKTACSYDDGNGGSFDLTDSCECTLTPVTDKKCRLNTASLTGWEQYKTDTLAALTALNKCNAVERTVKCRYYFDKTFQNEYDMINNWSLSKWKIENAHKISNLSPAAVQTAFATTSVFSPLIVPNPANPDDAKNTTLHTCPIFSCPDKKPDGLPYDTCAQGTVVTDPKNASLSHNAISLYQNCNTTTQFCNYQGSASYFAAQTANFDVKCVNRTSSATDIKRLPGEECSSDSDCAATKCTSGKCEGKAAGDACKEDKECVAGNVCVGDKCTAQAALNAPCTKDSECQNNLLCANSKCINMFSIKQGDKVTATGRDLTKDTYYGGLYCETGRYNKNTDTCVKRTYDMPNAVKDGDLIKCNPGSSCTYKETDGKAVNEAATAYCICGFSTTGQGYCPPDDSSTSNDWGDYRKYFAKQYDNKCHSLNRDNCYKNTFKDLKNYLEVKRKTIEVALWKDAPTCADKVLSSSFIQMSMGFLVVLAALLF